MLINIQLLDVIVKFFFMEYSLILNYSSSLYFIMPPAVYSLNALYQLFRRSSSLYQRQAQSRPHAASDGKYDAFIQTTAQ